MASSRLPDLLAAAYANAQEHRDLKEKLPLSGGAHVEFYITPGGECHLLVWRYRVYPSPVEWRTVLKCLPISVEPEASAKKTKVGKRFGLTAVWLMREAVPRTSTDRSVGVVPFSELHEYCQAHGLRVVGYEWPDDESRPTLFFERKEQA